MNKDATPVPGFAINTIATTSGLDIVDAAIAVPIQILNLPVGVCGGFHDLITSAF